MRIDTHVPIKSLTTFQNSGYLPEVVHVDTIDELKTILSNTSSYFILGKGSNTVISPHHHQGRCIKLSPRMIETKAKGTVLTLGAGMPVSMVMKQCLTYGLSGLQFSAGVPASIGGMVTMNFGCWGRSVSDVIDAVYILDETLTDRWVSPKELLFSYRWSHIQEKKWVVLGASFKLTPCHPDTLKKEIESIIQMRLDKQPLRDKTFGSVFKNPEGCFAGALIEQAGLKGLEMNGIKISDQHANFMVNQGEATFDDLVHVIQYVQREVKKISGITLQTEVKLLT